MSLRSQPIRQHLLKLSLAHLITWVYMLVGGCCLGPRLFVLLVDVRLARVYQRVVSFEILLFDKV